MRISGGAMLYSHIRFLIAEVEMPVSGPIYCTGGMLQAKLSFMLPKGDPLMYFASPLARTKYESIPVKLLGSKPNTTLADDEKVGIDNDIVIFDGSAELKVSYSESTGQLDIEVTAVPVSVKALNNIVYSMLSIGQYNQSVQSVVDAQYKKTASEGNAIKNVTTVESGTPHSANSILFLKKLVTQVSPAELMRPTDLAEYTVSNLLGYADSRMIQKEEEVAFMAADDSYRWWPGCKLGAIPDSMKDTINKHPRFGQEDGMSPAISQIKVYTEYGVLAAEFLCRQIMVDGTITKIDTVDGPTPDAVTDSVIEYLKKDKCWLPTKDFMITVVASALSEETTDIQASKVLPKCILAGLKMVSQGVDPKDKAAGLEGVLTTFALSDAIVNGFMKCFLSVFQFFTLRSTSREVKASLIDLMYDQESSDLNVPAGKFTKILMNTFGNPQSYTAIYKMLSDKVLAAEPDGTFWYNEHMTVDAWRAYIKTGVVPSKFKASIGLAESVTVEAIQLALSVIEEFKTQLREDGGGFIVGPFYLTSFSVTSQAVPQELRNNLDTIRGWMLNLYQVYVNILFNNNAEYYRYPNPTRFDIQAVRSVADNTLYNRIAAPDFLRTKADDSPERKYVYPHMILASFLEFKQLVAATASMPGSQTASLYMLLQALYRNLKLTLTNPLNKPLCVQPDKQISSDQVKVLEDKSLAELFLMPEIEMQAVPKCNVFAVDMRFGALTSYSERNNLSKLLIRYQPPLDVLADTDATAVPPVYYEFNVTDLSKPIGKVDPRTLEFEYTRKQYFDSGNKVYSAGYPLGVLYNLERTDIIDVSSEIALLQKLCQAALNNTKTDGSSSLTQTRSRLGKAAPAALQAAGNPQIKSPLTFEATFRGPEGQTSKAELNYTMDPVTGRLTAVLSSENTSESENVLDTYAAAAAHMTGAALKDNLDALQTERRRGGTSRKEWLIKWFRDQFIAGQSSEELAGNSLIQSLAVWAGSYAVKLLETPGVNLNSFRIGKDAAAKRYLNPKGSGIEEVYIFEFPNLGFSQFNDWALSLKSAAKHEVEGLFNADFWLTYTKKPEFALGSYSKNWTFKWFKENVDNLPTADVASVPPELSTLANAVKENPVTVNVKYGEIPSDLTLNSLQNLHSYYQKVTELVYETRYLALYKSLVEPLSEKLKQPGNRTSVAIVPGKDILADLALQTKGQADSSFRMNFTVHSDCLTEAAKRHGVEAEIDSEARLLLCHDREEVSTAILKAEQPELGFEKIFAESSTGFDDKNLICGWAKNYATANLDGAFVDKANQLGAYDSLLRGKGALVGVTDGQGKQVSQYTLVDPWFYNDEIAYKDSLPATLPVPAFIVTNPAFVKFQNASKRLLPITNLIKDAVSATDALSNKALIVCSAAGTPAATKPPSLTSKDIKNTMSTAVSQAKLGLSDRVHPDIKTTTITYTNIPAVVWYDKGSKASIVYLNLETGSYTDFTDIRKLNPGLAQPSSLYYALDTDSGNDWVPKTEEFKALAGYIKRNNPFDSNMFPLAGDQIVYKLLPLEKNLTLVKAAFQIPWAVFQYRLQQSTLEHPQYTEEWAVIDPRGEIALDVYDALQKFRLGGQTQTTTAAQVSGWKPASTEQEALRILFGDEASNVKLNSRSAANGLAVTMLGGGYTYAVSNPLDALIIDDYSAVRPAKSDKDSSEAVLRLHLGDDLSTNASPEPDWYNGTRIPQQGLMLPWDSLVMYGAQTNKDDAEHSLDGYGFFALAVPEQEDANYLEVMLIAHMNPARTFTEGPVKGIFEDADLNPRQKEARDKLFDLSKQCGDKITVDSVPGRTYFFNQGKYNDLRKSTQESDKQLVAFAKEYFAALYAAFGQSGTLRQQMFRVRKGERIGVMGASGTGSVHYHCEFYRLDRTKSDVQKLAKRIYQKFGNLTGLYDYLINTIHAAAKFPISKASAVEWDTVDRLRGGRLGTLVNEYGLQDFLDGVVRKVTALGGYGKASTPSDEMIQSVVMMRAYQEMLNRYCTAQPAPVNLPYYDPYIMDAGMPAAVVYRNDIVLTRIASLQLTAAGSQVTTSIMFTPGIAVGKMLPMYFRALLSMATVRGDLLKRVVFPFHCIEWFNDTAFNVDCMNSVYEHMFGKEKFVFDWRDIVLIQLDGYKYPVSVNTIIQQRALIENAFRVVTTQGIDDKFKIDLSKAGMSNHDFPMNEEQVMLTARAWSDSSLYKYTTSKSVYFSKVSSADAAIPFEPNEAQEYELRAIQQLQQTAGSIEWPLEIPRTYYDWHNLFLTLRKSIRTAAPLIPRK